MHQWQVDALLPCDKHSRVSGAVQSRLPCIDVMLSDIVTTFNTAHPMSQRSCELSTVRIMTCAQIQVYTLGSAPVQTGSGWFKGCTAHCNRPQDPDASELGHDLSTTLHGRSQSQPESMEIYSKDHLHMSHVGLHWRVYFPHS